MDIKFVLIAFVIVGAVVAVVLAKAKARGAAGKYKQRELMTANELEFFGRLVKALPDHYIFPQVAMSALLEPLSSEKKQAHSDRLRIAQQRTDYVVCDPNCGIVAVVELDDRTHSRIKDETRDERLKMAGIRTVRFQSSNKPTTDAIRATLLVTSQAPAASARAVHREVKLTAAS